MDQERERKKKNASNYIDYKMDECDEQLLIYFLPAASVKKEEKEEGEIEKKFPNGS